jgi:methanogenic corrinoid protein MtbC1
MKDESRVASEHQFIINVVFPTLVGVKNLSRTFLWCVCTYIDGGFHDIGIDLIVIDQ